MKVKKWLKEKSREEEKKILAENQAIYADLYERVRTAEEQRKKKQIYRRPLIAALSFSVTAAIFCCIFFPVWNYFNVMPVQPTPPVYYEENIKNRTITLEELNEKNSIFLFKNVQGFVPALLDCFYDSESGDILYYRLRLFDNGIKQVEILYYSNPYYNNSVNFITAGSSANVNRLTVKYSENITEDMGVYIISSQGEIEQNNQSIYLTYSEYALEENSGFLSFIENFIELKE